MPPAIAGSSTSLVVAASIKTAGGRLERSKLPIPLYAASGHLRGDAQTHPRRPFPSWEDSAQGASLAGRRASWRARGSPGRPGRPTGVLLTIPTLPCIRTCTPGTLEPPSRHNPQQERRQASQLLTDLHSVHTNLHVSLFMIVSVIPTNPFAYSKFPE